MNIEEVKKKIADHEAGVAVEADKTVEELRKMRDSVKYSTAQRHVIIAAAKREIRRQLDELQLRHRTEVLEMKQKIEDDLVRLDTEPDVAIHRHIAGILNIDARFVPDMIRACQMMDDYERSLWAEYRRPKTETDRKGSQTSW